MKYKSYIFFLLIILLACSSKTKTVTETSVKAVYIQKDKEIFEQILQKFSSEKDASTTELMIKVGTCFIDTPYVAHTLETEPEQLVVNLRELDCTTFAENCLAIARTIKSETPSFEQFTCELQNIRYRNGVIDGYLSRIHYFSDWIFENSKNHLVKDISKETANT
ncbi:MAG TPA: N-acetylmuramoyl-L-alanine amidase-like domain-containing protein, partial [Draconibacterium sp.]|nr:N-acetylmuramoyl-L-alanine amidase-like domain-containing protein [Draconibacterium sp.]